jgi:hypothetical protein
VPKERGRRTGGQQEKDDGEHGGLTDAAIREEQ